MALDFDVPWQFGAVEGPDEYKVPSHAYPQQPLLAQYRCLMCGQLMQITVTLTMEYPQPEETLYEKTYTIAYAPHPVVTLMGTMQHLC